MLENICNLHKRIIMNSENAIELLKTGNKERILEALIKIKSDAEKTLTAGRKLEKRLADYRIAIESLGFFRFKGGNKEVKVTERTKDNFNL